MQFDKCTSDGAIVAPGRPKRRHTGEPLQLPCRFRLNKDWDWSSVESRPARLLPNAGPTRLSFVEALSSLTARILVAILDGFALYAIATGSGFVQPPGAATDLDELDNL